MINIGNKILKSAFVGTRKVKDIYVGANKVWSASRLPSEYQEVEYLESTGTQYIDTGFVMPSSATNITWGLVIAFSELVENGYIGAYQNLLLGYRNNSISSNGATINQDVIVGRVYDVELSLRGTRRYTTIDETEYIGTSANSASSRRFFLFMTNGGTYQGTKTKIYKATMFNAGVLQRDFIPCYRKADGEKGMYDLVEGVFYTNQGTGQFLVGADVN